MRRELLIEKYIHPNRVYRTEMSVSIYWDNKYGQASSINDQPAIIYAHEEVEYRKVWAKNGILHREKDRPAEVAYFENGQILEEFYNKNGILHRDGNKPAHIRYYKNGKISEKRFYRNGICIKSKNY